MVLTEDNGLSRRETALVRVAYVQQLPLDARPGSRAWVHQAMRLRVVDTRAERDLAAHIVKRRHYLGRWPARPRTLVLSYLASLDGVIAGDAEAAGLVMITLQPAQCHVARALGVEQYERLTVDRMWRANDLAPAIAPDFTPELLRRVVRGERGSRRSTPPILPLVDEWTARKCREGGLRARPRLLVTHADPAVGHDGATYLSAGATYCGPTGGGKLAFAWPLDERLREPLRALGRAVEERRAA